jgi:hypothetical protein
MAANGTTSTSAPVVLKMRMHLLVPILALLTTLLSVSLTVLFYRSQAAVDEYDKRIRMSSSSGSTSIHTSANNSTSIGTSSTPYNAKAITTAAYVHHYPEKNSPAVLPKILVVYFPQYHQEPLNDRLWGTGFTDWDNLRDAPPQLNREGYRIIRPTSTSGTMI